MTRSGLGNGLIEGLIASSCRIELGARARKKSRGKNCRFKYLETFYATMASNIVDNDTHG